MGFSSVFYDKCSVRIKFILVLITLPGIPRAIYFCFMKYKTNRRGYFLFQLHGSTVQFLFYYTQL